MKIGTVILAAGESARMGSPKQLLPFRGKPLIRWMVDAAAGFDRGPSVIVVGAYAPEIRASLGPLPADTVVVENLNWRRGMGSSLRVGLSHLLQAGPDVAAAVFLLCDQPWVNSDTLAALAAEHDRTRLPIVASAYANAMGVPALFFRELFPELLSLPDGQGARAVIQADPSRTARIPFPEGAVDIDTPDAYRALCEANQPTLV